MCVSEGTHKFSLTAFRVVHVNMKFMHECKGGFLDQSGRLIPEELKHDGLAKFELFPSLFGIIHDYFTPTALTLNERKFTFRKFVILGWGLHF